MEIIKKGSYVKHKFSSNIGVVVEDITCEVSEERKVSLEEVLKLSEEEALKLSGSVKINPVKVKISETVVNLEYSHLTLVSSREYEKFCQNVLKKNYGF